MLNIYLCTMFALVDANNFFVSCEKVFRPDLEGKPVVVLSNNDGCIISRSNEAKALGLQMGEPYFKRKKFLKDNNVTVFSGNYSLYGDMSRRVMQTLRELAPDVEIYSIDEAFLDLSGIEEKFLIPYASKIKRTVEQWTAIPVSIGVGKTKTLAKLASEAVKKHRIKTGVLILNKPETIENLLKQTAIEDIWGIGYRWGKKLKEDFIYTAYDFVKMSDFYIKKKMGISGLRIKHELLGQSAFEMHNLPEAKKSIRRSRSFGILIEKKDDLEEAIANFADACAYKLRQKKEVAYNITVYIKTDKHRKDLAQYRNSITITLKSPSNGSKTIINAALEGLNKIYKEGFKYRKAGVVVTGLETASNIQLNLFEKGETYKEQNLMKTIDLIRNKYGRNSIEFAIEKGNGNWRPRQLHISPKYTTDWKDLPEIKN